MTTKENYSIELKEGHELIAFCEYSETAFIKITEQHGFRIAEFTLSEISDEYGFSYEGANDDDATNLHYFNDCLFNSEDKDDCDSKLSFTY